MCLRKPNPGEFYRDKEKQLCQIITVAKDKKRELDMVVYQELYGYFLSYTSEIGEFLEEYERVVPKDTSAKEADLTREKKNWNEEIAREDREKEELDREQGKTQDLGEREYHKKEEVEKRFFAFLDAESSREKLELLYLLHDDLDLRLVNNIAASMDLPADEEDIEKQYEFFVQNLKQRIKFECDRFRK